MGTKIKCGVLYKEEHHQGQGVSGGQLGGEQRMRATDDPQKRGERENGPVEPETIQADQDGVDPAQVQGQGPVP